MCEYTGEDDATWMVYAPLPEWEVTQKVAYFLEIKDGMPSLDTTNHPEPFSATNHPQNVSNRLPPCS